MEDLTGMASATFQAAMRDKKEDMDGLQRTESITPSILSVRAMRQRIVALEEENKELRERTYCAYCGEMFLVDDEAASKVTEHIHTCEKHPMRDVEAENERLRKALADNLAINLAVTMGLRALRQSIRSCEATSPFRLGIEAACEEIEYRMEHTDEAMKDLVTSND